jgi:hypothetical protein
LGTRILRDNENMGARIGGKLVPAPEGAGCELGLDVGGLVKKNLRGRPIGLCRLVRFSERRRAGSGLPPRAPGVEEGALGGQDAVKAGQKQRRSFERVVFKQRDQFEREPGGAEQAAGAAGLVKGREPVAEGRRILLP